MGYDFVVVEYVTGTDGLQRSVWRSEEVTDHTTALRLARALNQSALPGHRFYAEED